MIATMLAIGWLYAAWLAVGAVVLWALARWSALRPLHVSVLFIAAIASLICIGSVVYALAATAGPPRSPLRLLLAHRGPPVLLMSFLLWPIVVCAATARISRRLGFTPPASRWLSFGCGVVISVVAPFALLIGGCGLAGVCW